MGKGKLKKFAENETFACLIQPSTEELLGRDHPLKGNWKQTLFHNDRPIVLELGCGKGEYTVALAERFPEKNYIGIDIKGARLWKGAKYATEHALGNVAFVRTRVELIESLFGPGEIDEIWLTFSDPQERKARKRLTHPRFLESYRRMLPPGGIIHLKTDSRLLYHYTLEVARCNGLPVVDCDEDIYTSGRADSGLLSIQTFYEKNFRSQGIPITYLAFRLDGEGPLAEPEWDQTPYLQTYRTLTRS